MCDPSETKQPPHDTGVALADCLSDTVSQPERPSPMGGQAPHVSSMHVSGASARKSDSTSAVIVAVWTSRKWKTTASVKLTNKEEIA